MGLLCSRSRSQRMFKMSVNVCPNDIFWITEHFVTKFGMVMQHHEPERRAVIFVVVAIFKVKVTVRALMIKIYGSFYYIFWTVDSLSTKLGLMIHHHKPECPVKKVGLLHSGSMSQWRVKMLMSVQMISSTPSSILLPNLVLWCIIMQELIWSKYDNVSGIFWAADPFAAILGLIVHYHKPECFMKMLECCVQGQGHSKISKCEWMFVQMMSSETLNLLLPNLVWWCIILSQILSKR